MGQLGGRVHLYLQTNTESPRQDSTSMDSSQHMRFAEGKQCFRSKTSSIEISANYDAAPAPNDSAASIILHPSFASRPLHSCFTVSAGLSSRSSATIGQPLSHGQQNAHHLFDLSRLNISSRPPGNYLSRNGIFSSRKTMRPQASS